MDERSLQRLAKKARDELLKEKEAEFYAGGIGSAFIEMIDIKRLYEDGEYEN